jgi:hypothetical protein
VNENYDEEVIAQQRVALTAVNTLQQLQKKFMN